MKDVLLKDVMVTHVISLREDEHFSRVEQELRTHHIRHLPIVNHENKLVGIITQRDLFRIMSPRITEEGYFYDTSSLDQFILKHKMTPNPLALKPESTVAEVIHIMADHKYGCIPIVDQSGTLVGIVTQVDILKYVSRWLKA
jgi:CBS-domain-containing membrane protein